MKDNENLDLILNFLVPSLPKEIDTWKLSCLINQFPITRKEEYWSKAWLWVMLLVEKIESIRSNHHGYFGVHISSNSCSIQGTNLHRSINDLKDYGWVYNDEVVLDTKLESTYQACLNFINWYNKQNEDGFTFI